MDIKVTIRDKRKPRRDRGAKRVAGIMFALFLVASWVCSRIYLDGYHNKALLVLFILFGALSTLSLLVFLAFAVKRNEDLF